uniref:Interleukin 23 receptor n=1 Tax=Astyanax mexicanus TaxID=7994 RepID=A0A3B1IM81_ASTMX
MDFSREVMQIVFLVLLFCRLTDCYSVICAGHLTVDKDIIPMGSNLTVHCKSNTEQCNRLFIIELNGQTILQKNSCSSVTTQLVVTQPKFSLHCKVKQGRTVHNVCGRDIVADLIPSAPHIKTIELTKGSLSATIHWQSPDNMELLKPKLRFRKTDGSSVWMTGKVIQHYKGKVMMLDDLEPLTSYEFELRVCTISLEINCSHWSEPVRKNSSGQAPLNKLDVWRVIRRNEGSDTLNVTVLWKALSSEDYKGDLLGYELVYKEKNTTHTLNCSVTTIQYTLQLHHEVTRVNVSAVTSAGNSPPAPAWLICAETPVPTLHLSQTAEGRIHLAWNSSHQSYINISEQTSGFVVQWQTSPFEVQWKRIKKDKISTFIDDIPPCSTVNVSLCVESIEGVSRPVSGQILVKDRKSPPGPGHNDNKIPKGEYIVPDPVKSAADGPGDMAVIGICVMAVVPVFILINLMYLKCARKRIRKVCMSVGPSWLFPTLPKLGNSNAIKLLQNEKYGSEICWQPLDSDPPLSPVEDFSPSVELRDCYPVTHTEETTDEKRVEQDWAVCAYKPQISIVSQRIESVSETAETEEDEHPWPVFSPGFFPSQGIHGPLKSCLTVDGTPVSVDVVDGVFFITQSTLEEDVWSVAGNVAFAAAGNGEENSYQGQTVLPNDFVKCLREPSCNVRPHLPKSELNQSCMSRQL